MRKLAVLLAITAGLMTSAGTALASIPGPGLPNPTDCHSMNAFLHIDNVRDCDGNNG